MALLLAASDGATDVGDAGGSGDVVGGDDALGGGHPATDASNSLDSSADVAVAAGVAAAAALEAEAEAEGGEGVAAAVVSTPPSTARTGDFVSKEHSRAGPFKAVLLYFDYVRWLWSATDKARLDREQAGGQVSERVKVRF